MPTYSRPKLTDLGQVEDLTQLTIIIKTSQPGTDIHVSRSGVSAQSGPGNHVGLTASF